MNTLTIDRKVYRHASLSMVLNMFLNVIGLKKQLNRLVWINGELLIMRNHMIIIKTKDTSIIPKNILNWHLIQHGKSRYMNSVKTMDLMLNILPQSHLNTNMMVELGHIILTFSSMVRYMK